MYWLMPTCCSQRSTELFPSSPGNRPSSSAVLNTLDAADTSLVLRVDEAGRRYSMLLEAALAGLLGMHQPKASAFPGVGSCGVGPPCGGLGGGRMGLLLSGSLASRTVVVERCAQHHMARNPVETSRETRTRPNVHTETVSELVCTRTRPKRMLRNGCLSSNFDNYNYEDDRPIGLFDL